MFSFEPWLREVARFIPWRTPKGEIWQALKGLEESFGLQVYNFSCSLNVNLLQSTTHFGPDASSVPWRSHSTFSLILLEEGADLQPCRWCGAMCYVGRVNGAEQEGETAPHSALQTFPRTFVPLSSPPPLVMWVFLLLSKKSSPLYPEFTWRHLMLKESHQCCWICMCSPVLYAKVRSTLCCKVYSLCFRLLMHRDID